MDLSGLIFVVLALAWAGYLLPRALRQHDGLAADAPVDTSSDTARVLNRTPAMMRALLADTAPVDPARREADKVALRASEDQRRAALPRPVTRGAAVRRRRILLVLLAATALVAGAAGLGHLSWWSVTGPGLLVVGWLVLCVLMARAARVAARRPARRVLEAVAEVASDEAVAPVPASPLVAEMVAEVVEVAAVAVVQDDDVDDALWDPLPITLPTYVGKPAARRTVRTIELAQAGVTSSGHDAADSALVRRGGTPPAATAEAEDQPAVRRAAGA